MKYRAVAVVAIAIAVAAPAAARAQVLRVGSYKGIPGQFGTVQAAVDAARPGDWTSSGRATTRQARAAPRRTRRTHRRPC